MDVEKVTEAVMRQRLPQMTYRVKVGVNPRGLGFANIAFESDSAAETARVALDRVDLSELPLQVCWEPTAHELAESSHQHLATSPP